MSETPKNPFEAMMAQAQEMAKALNPALESFSPKGFEALWPTMPKEVMEMMFGNFLEQLLANPTSVVFMVAGTVTVLAFAASRFAMVPVISIAWQLDFTEARKRHAERFMGLRGRLFRAFLVLLGLSFLISFAAGKVFGGPAGLLLGGLADWIIGLALPISVAAAVLYDSAMSQQAGPTGPSRE